MPQLAGGTGSAGDGVLVHTWTGYCANKVYENDTLRMSLFDGGYVSYDTKADASLLSTSCHYYVKDHLGDNRVVLGENGEIEQVNHYYPFGGLTGGSENLASSQRYKYNGKELDRTHGLDWYDYGARMYDPALARWIVPDPLAEKYYSISPYAYCGGNPINIRDISGKDWAVDSLGNAHYNASWNENTILPDGYKYYGETGNGFKDILNGITCCRLEKNGSVTDLYSVKDAVITPSTNISAGLSAFSWALQTKADLFEYAIRERLKIGWEAQTKLNRYGSAKRIEIQSRAIGNVAAKYLKMTKDIGIGTTVLNTLLTFNATENDISNGDYIAGGARILTNGLIYATNVFPYVGPFISNGLGIVESVYGDYLYYYLQDKYNQ